MPIIETEALVYAYNTTSAPAVNDITRSIEPGSFVAVLGHNGSGKSTFAKLINALYVPSSGQAIVCGLDTQLPENTWVIRQRAGMVFQNPDNQIVATVVEEDVAFGPENLGVESSAIRERVDTVLNQVGMLDFAKSAPHMLSGGQKQRVAIAGALAMQPEILILDEATAMLDPEGRREVLQTVFDLRENTGMTVLWITHTMEEAVLADRVIVLHEGEVALDGTPREVFAQVDRLRDLRLEAPAMTTLAAELRAAGMPLRTDCLTVEELATALAELLA